MSAGFDVALFGEEGGELARKCAVISIYEDLGGRDLLLQLCDSLVWKFKDQVDFQVDWCRFKYLADPEIAMESAHKAAQADLILLAPQSAVLPTYVQGWFEGWLPNRDAGDGALVLVQSSAKEASQSIPLRYYLRQTARRARLDYLRLSAPGTIAGFSLSQPELSELLANDDRPVHWGINE
jgi:hypothetical protein